MRKTYLIIAALLGSLNAFAASNAEMIVVCNPGGYVKVKDANGAIGSLLRVVELVGQWQNNTFSSLFTTKMAECKQLMAEINPKFAITSLGLYLELRDRYNLVPVVQPRIKGRTSERYRVVVSKGKYKSLDELKGKTLGGTVLEEADFIAKIVFADKYKPANFFNLKKSNQAIQALRSIEKGELDAVILNEQQFNGLSSLHLETPLDVFFTSEEIPLIGVVANSVISTTKERNRFGKALEAMCTDTEGKKLCQLFGVDAFVSVSPELYTPLLKRWSDGQ